ncbi:GntR family transcriptional regulator [Marinomonas polaris]|uniref:Transcriptional regulator, GntR family n=1 Tax=Marinomonas polaris DSM 16579 TaxID=1122206 RepID=A0A1M5HBF6_9GAMM|nr:GntR family transcriptional regulator [Marinomonas polaris]SHG13319.1 transcriptional regulator, GntR family [Marinomonas polaris DSM 16579]|tara:strand:- start:9351 stop:10022 length:672 start_codon:yes stop_codon:yes gene_type:complete
MSENNKQKAVLSVTEDIRAKILDGTYPEGMALSQVDIASTYQVSRTPVREALQILAGEELVEIRDTGRATVTTISPESFLEKCELRALIEVKLLELSIPLMGAEDIAKARELNESLKKCAPEEWTPLNYLFHEILYKPANRPLMQNVIKDLHHRHYARLKSFILSHRNTPRSLREHDELIDRCERQDIEGACYALESHIMMSAYALAEQLKSQQLKRRQTASL